MTQAALVIPAHLKQSPFAPIQLGNVLVHNRHHGPVPAGFFGVYVGRPSVLGNPFKVGEGFAQGEAAAAYLPWLREQCKTDTPARRELLELARRVMRGENVALICSCAPRPCHAEHVRTAVLAYATLVYTENATGHRPDKLGGWDNPQARERLVSLAYAYQKRRLEQVLAAGIKQYRTVGGMAQGWDLAWTRASVMLRDEGHPVLVHAGAPYPSQPDIWPAHSPAKAEWRSLMDAADEVVYTYQGKPANKGHAAQLLNQRNMDMVGLSQRVVALWNGTSGGTGNCVRYAVGLDEKHPLTQPCPVTNLWPSWERHHGLVPRALRQAQAVGA